MQREWKIRVPCEKSFEELEGLGARRYCDQCRLHVHDFSQMKRADIAEFMDGSRGRVCAQILYGIDGAMVTADAPTGRQRVRRAFLKTAASVGLFWLGWRKPLGAKEVKGLRGVVIDVRGSGIENAVVLVKDGEREVARVVTDKSGRFAVDVEVAKRDTVRFEARGFKSFERTVGELGDLRLVAVRMFVGSVGGPEEAVSPLPLKRAGKVRGVVVDPDGSALAGAIVVAKDEGGTDWPVRETTDAKGNFQISLPGGLWIVRIEKAGLMPLVRQVEVKAGNTVNLSRCELRLGGAITGMVDLQGGKRSWWRRVWGR